jgi:4-hydroxy-tetrahydrodipicolinate reductase
MKTIGIVGMGRMGQSIASILENQTEVGFQTFQRLSPDQYASLKKCDVVIEFTVPDAAPGVIMQCIEHQIPVVSGTTGWHEYYLESVLSFCDLHHGTFLYATNFSIGMNIMFALNRKLSAVMASLPQFKPSLKEIHHVHKKDSPSGTAYTLLEDIFKHHPEYSGFVLNPVEQKNIPENRLPVIALREGEVKGYHEVTWNSGAEHLQIVHEAFDRKIFAEGAIMAAKWLMAKKPGVYTMKDIIHI